LYPIADFDLHLDALFENRYTTCYLRISVVCKAREQFGEGTIKPVVVFVNASDGPLRLSFKLGQFSVGDGRMTSCA
jgi:hypothetical protein